MKKRLFIFLLCMCMTVSLLPMQVFANDIASDDGWHLDDKGCLYITGEVVKATQGINDQPWKKVRSLIKTVVAETGASIKGDGTFLFADCSNLTSVDLSKLDTSAMTSADVMFESCTALTTLNLGSNFQYTGQPTHFLDNCGSLSTLTVPPKMFELFAETLMGIAPSGWKDDAGHTYSLEGELYSLKDVTDTTQITLTKIVPIVYYNVWVNGEQFSSDKLVIACDEGTAAYNPDNATLNLNGAKITKAYDDGAIRAYSDITISVVGNCSILPGKSGKAHGIYTNGKLNLAVLDNIDILADSKNNCGICSDSANLYGGGNLIIDAGFCGIYTLKDLKIEGGVNVTVDAGKYGFALSNGSVTLFGKGKMDIYGSETGIILWGEENDVKLIGDGNLTIKADTDNKAVFNNATQNSIVKISNIDKRTVTGTPSSNYVAIVYSGPYEVWVNGVQFGRDNLTIDCDEGTATYDPDTETLTLDNAKITKSCNGAAIRACGSLTINLVGDCSILLDNSDSSSGIYTDSNLILTGPGNLELRAEKVESCGLYSGRMEITGSGNVSITAGLNGIYASWDVVISGSGNVTVDAGKYGIFEFNSSVTISGSGNVTVKGVEAGIYIQNNSLILSGSGEVYIYGANNGIDFWGEDAAVLLNGKCSRITLEAGDGKKAVFNGSVRGVSRSPVAGDNFDKYAVEGSPDSKYVNYTYTTQYSIAMNVTGKQFTLTVFGPNTNKGVVSAVLYDNNNQLVEVKVFDLSKIEPMQGTFTKNGNKVKAMWWDSLNTMTPICDAVESTI